MHQIATSSADPALDTTAANQPIYIQSLIGKYDVGIKTYVEMIVFTPATALVTLTIQSDLVPDLAHSLQGPPI